MSVTFHDRPAGVLLTKGDLEAWHSELAALEEEVTNIYARMEDVRERIEAAEHLISLTAPRAALQALSPPVQDVPLTDAIMRVFERERRPLKAPEVRTFLNRDPTQAARLKSNPNYFHTAMKRLRDRGQLVREGDADRLPAKENGAPNGNAASAPEADEAATSSYHQPQTHDVERQVQA